MYSRLLKRILVSLQKKGVYDFEFFVAPKIIANYFHMIKYCDSTIGYLNNSTFKYTIDGFLAKDVALDLILLKLTSLNKPAVKIALFSFFFWSKKYI